MILGEDMRINKEDDDGAETPLLEDGDNVVTIFNNSDSDTPDSRSARRTRSTTERIRSRNSVLVGARRTPSSLFKSSHDAGPQNEVSKAHQPSLPAFLRTPRQWSHTSEHRSRDHYPQLELVVFST